MKFILIFTLCFINVFGFAQSGSLDNTFGTSGKVTTDLGGISETALSVVTQFDGKIVAVGNRLVGGNSDFALVRYNDDGSLDNTFGSNGKAITDFGSNSEVATSVAVQNDGKIIVAGSTVNGAYYDCILIRYNSNGTLDTIFGVGGKVITSFGSFDDYGNSVVIQSNGKIVMSGYSYNGSQDVSTMARYNTDGSLDATFGIGGKIMANSVEKNGCNSLTIQNDGKFLVVGDSGNKVGLLRYMSNGVLDNAFGSGGKVTTTFGYFKDSGRSVAIQSDGKIVVIAISWDGLGVDLSLARFNSDGSLDTTFGFFGKVTTVRNVSTIGASVRIQNDGKIVVIGDSYGGDYDFAILRYNSDGSLDNAFDADGIVTTDFGSVHDRGFSGCLQNDGKIVVAGNTYNGSDYDFAVARYYGNVVGIEKNTMFNNMSVYPNPSSGIFSVNMPNKNIPTKICVYDVLGNCLWNKECQNDVSQKIDLSSEAAGIYFAKLLHETKQEVIKLIKE